MKDENKTKKQLIDELVGLRQHITNLEKSGTERNVWRLQFGKRLDMLRAL